MKDDIIGVTVLLVFIGGCWVLLSIPRLFRWLFSIDPLNAPPRLAAKAGERPEVRWQGDPDKRPDYWFQDEE